MDWMAVSSLRQRHAVQRRRAHPEGPRHRPHRPPRAHRRGHHRLRSHPQLAAVATCVTRGAASVEICALLRKPDAAKVEVDVKYLGFDIPNEFVVGYGLDYAEKYRNLRDVGILAPHVYS